MNRRKILGQGVTIRNGKSLKFLRNAGSQLKGMRNKLTFISILKERRMLSQDGRLGNTHTADSWAVPVIHLMFFTNGSFSRLVADQLSNVFNFMV